MLPLTTLCKRHSSLLLTLRLLALAAFIGFTNAGFAQRIALLVDQERWGTLVGFVGVWCLCLAALLIAALQPSPWLRLGWAAVLAATAAVAVGFRTASSAEFGVFDAISLWNARHEAARAIEFYSASIVWMEIAFICGFAVLATPPGTGPRLRRLMARLAWAPAVPIALITVIIYAKEGGGAHALPTQFTPLSVGIVSGVSMAASPDLQRKPVAWTPSARKIHRIVVIVDESIRGDYIDWTPGNAHTPELARAKARIVDFGQAASGGNCSHYSNALLRFAATRENLGRGLLASPTLWQFAKKAGYRTVFIDAQAGFLRNPGKLQNFMTPEETREIDALHALDDSTPPHLLDDKLLDAMLDELRSKSPVFIFANKNGAHFPYDRGYPVSEREFRPTMSEARDAISPRVNSYRNVVKWSVDRFFHRLFAELDLSDMLVLYTSDHGQAFNPGAFSHCSLESPDPREALVPLFASTGNEALRARFAAAAPSHHGRASHFAIAPTLLELMGYDATDIARLNSVSLLQSNPVAPAFTSGDVFGLFSSRVRWHAIDLRRSYLEYPDVLEAGPSTAMPTEPRG